MGWVAAAGWCTVFGCSVVDAGVVESMWVETLGCSVTGFGWDVVAFGCVVAGAVSAGFEPDAGVVACSVVAGVGCAGYT